MSGKDHADYLSLIVDSSLNVSVFMHSLVFMALIVLAIIFVLFPTIVKTLGNLKTFEINEAELGIGNQKIRLRPNNEDREIAYKIWVELSTRKLGLPIDLENDVIIEIYNSWYKFFHITRELAKDVPTGKFTHERNYKVANLAIEILNQGVRPHLTKWHAKYRKWHLNQTDKANDPNITPQDLQKLYPLFHELSQDMLAVNQILITYKERMYELAHF